MVRLESYSRRVLVIMAGIFFVSGFSALLYQVAWQRMLGLFSGSDVRSATIVVGAYLAGLGVGSLVGSLIADRLDSRQAVLYLGLCNLGIAIFAIISRLLFYDLLFRQLIILLKFPSVEFIIIFASLLWPTTLMGLSLPLMSKALVRNLSKAAGLISLLYGINTLGAGVGTLVSGWYLIGTIGYEYTVYVGGLLSALVGIIALLLARQFNTRDRDETASVSVKPDLRLTPKSVWVWCLLVLTSGFVAISLELIWFRVLGVILRSNAYTFAHVLAFILFGYAVGSMFGAHFVGHVHNPRQVFLWIQGLVALYSVLIIWYIALTMRDGFIGELLTASSGQIAPTKLTTWLPGYILLPTIMLLPQNILIGFYFPVVQKAVQTDERLVGQRVSLVQVANIIGNVMGSILTGLLMLNIWGTAGSLRAICILGLLLVLVSLRDDFSGSRHLTHEPASSGTNQQDHQSRYNRYILSALAGLRGKQASLGYRGTEPTSQVKLARQLTLLTLLSMLVVTGAYQFIPYRVDIGLNNQAYFRDFHDLESDAARGLMWRWSKDTSQIVFPNAGQIVPSQCEVTLEVTLASARPPDRALPQVELKLHGRVDQHLATFYPPNEITTYKFLIDPSLAGNGDWALVITSETFQLKGDARNLGVSVQGATLRVYDAHLPVWPPFPTALYAVLVPLLLGVLLRLSLPGKYIDSAVVWLSVGCAAIIIIGFGLVLYREQTTYYLPFLCAISLILVACQCLRLLLERIFLLKQSTRIVSGLLLSLALLMLSILYPDTTRFWAQLHHLEASELFIVAEDSSGVAALRDRHNFVELSAEGQPQGTIPFLEIHTILGGMPALIHPAPKRALIIGIGSGGTPYAAGINPRTEEVVAVEILGAELTVLKEYSTKAQGQPLKVLFNDERYKIIVGDGRRELALSDNKFDVIEADAILPWKSHSGMLYSKEFFEQARSELADGGIMVQWCATSRTEATFVSVFPYALKFTAGPTLVLVGSNSPISYDPQAVLHRLEGDPRFAEYLNRGGINFASYKEIWERVKVSETWTPSTPRKIDDINTDLFPKDEYYMNR